MELETKITKDVDGNNAKEETIRHWTDKDMKEIHKSNGKTWRNNKTDFKFRPISKAFRTGYSEINWEHK